MVQVRQCTDDLLRDSSESFSLHLVSASRRLTVRLFTARTALSAYQHLQLLLRQFPVSIRSVFIQILQILLPGSRLTARWIFPNSCTPILLRLVVSTQLRSQRRAVSWLRVGHHRHLLHFVFPQRCVLLRVGLVSRSKDLTDRRPQLQMATSAKAQSSRGLETRSTTTRPTRGERPGRRSSPARSLVRPR
jgi:hypothetical protein